MWRGNCVDEWWCKLCCECEKERRKLDLMAMKCLWSNPHLLVVGSQTWDSRSSTVSEQFFKGFPACLLWELWFLIFKKFHSTHMCIYAQKETARYYHNLRTPVFTCFLEIKSAYDRVCHDKLFNKFCREIYPSILFFYWSNGTPVRDSVMNGDPCTIMQQSRVLLQFF